MIAHTHSSYDNFLVESSAVLLHLEQYHWVGIYSMPHIAALPYDALLTIHAVLEILDQ